MPSATDTETYALALRVHKWTFTVINTILNSILRNVVVAGTRCKTIHDTQPVTRLQRGKLEPLYFRKFSKKISLAARGINQQGFSLSFK